MKYMGNIDFWNQKFKNRDNQIMKPEDALVNAVSLFKEGSVLDIACGDGRNSIYLLSEGFQVTGIDFSQEALQRLRSFANHNNYSVKTYQMDLSEPQWIEKIDTFDNIIICHYRLHAEQLDKIHQYVNRNGILFITGFGHKQKVDNRISEMDLIMPEDFRTIEDHFEKIEYREFEDGRGSFVTYIFKRK